MVQLFRELLRVASRRTGWIAGATLALAYTWMALRGPQGLQSLFEKHQEIRDLQEQNADKSRLIEDLKQRIDRLQNSSSEQELEIRKELKLMRPGETEFLLPNAPKEPAAPAK